MPQLIVLVVSSAVWAFASRPGRIRNRTAAALLIWAAAALLLSRLVPVLKWDLIAAALPVATLIIVLGRRQYTRHADHRPNKWPIVVLAALNAVLCCAGGPVLLLVEQRVTEAPAPDGVLPLPDGLRGVQEGPTGREACGNATCITYVRVTGRPGQSDADLAAEVRRHIASRHADGCHRLGLLVDRRKLCTSVGQGHDGSVSIVLELAGGDGI
ncbi:hypothetical protein [Actinoplanes sp. L3-i22]|uniref:hypothetical protein n=1 Tax=Actinoplanes sp. L3-i22 TaxID=2836373 RepID=UPI001C7545BF|nr:hypothetical protein [Actinoplanes sp. L3-i22]BCY06078.1 hypothetical protein L3i22_011660 [Actinoplanes sp. L3-i22]